MTTEQRHLLISTLRVPVERLIDECSAYCTHLKNSSFPTLESERVLELLSRVLPLYRASYTEAVDKLTEDMGSPQQDFVSSILSLNTATTTAVNRLSRLLGDIRNARYAIVPSRVIPVFTDVVQCIAKYYEDTWDHMLANNKPYRQAMEIALTLSESEPTKSEPRDNQTCSKLHVLPLFSGVELRPDESLVSFEVVLARYITETTSLSWVPTFHFPILDRNSVLLLPLLFHEVGHLILFLHRNARAQEKNQATRTATSEQQATHSHQQDIASDERTRKSWYDEAVADAIAARIFGPAYAVALVEFAGRGLDCSPTTSHPSPRLRFSWVIDVLRNMRYETNGDLETVEKLSRIFEGLEKIDKQKGIILAKGVRQARKSQIPDLEELNKQFLENQEQVSRDAQEILNSLVNAGVISEYDATRHDQAVRGVRERLLKLLPPNELTDSNKKEPQTSAVCHPVAILNSASLLYRLDDDGVPCIEKFRQKLGVKSDASGKEIADCISRLIRKGLELSYLQKLVGIDNKWSW